MALEGRKKRHQSLTWVSLSQVHVLLESMYSAKAEFHNEINIGKVGKNKFKYYCFISQNFNMLMEL